MAKVLTTASYISIDGADPVPLESLSAAEKEAARQKIAKQMGEAMSDYYSTHPESLQNMRKLGYL